jgi:hypothetical protein
MLPLQPALPKARPVVAASAAWGQWRPSIRPPMQLGPTKGQGKAAVLPRSPEVPLDPDEFWRNPEFATFPKSGAWSDEQMRVAEQSLGRGGVNELRYICMLSLQSMSIKNKAQLVTFLDLSVQASPIGDQGLPCVTARAF